MRIQVYFLRFFLQYFYHKMLEITPKAHCLLPSGEVSTHQIIPRNNILSDKLSFYWHLPLLYIANIVIIRFVF